MVRVSHSPVLRNPIDCLTLIPFADPGAASDHRDIEILERGALWLADFLLDASDIVQGDGMPNQTLDD
jgi:hypothetical protein